MATFDREQSPTRNTEQDLPSERTPLIERASDGPEAPDQSRPHRQHSAYSTLQTIQSGKKASWRRWPSLLALLLLCVVVVLIIVLGFIAPSVVERYAQQAVQFEPTSLSIDSFTSNGVKARIQGDFMMDASRVHKKAVRDLGRLGTWIAREVETGKSEVEVVLPEYGNVLLGTAHVPGIKVDVRNKHKTHVDFTSDLEPGDVDGIRRIANDWIDGRLGKLRVLGKANVPLKSGIFSFGSQQIVQEMVFANEDIPTIPAYKIKKLNFREVDIPTGRGMAADVSLKVQNEYPVDFTIPPLGFGILVDNCMKSDPRIMVADATTHSIHIQPNHDIELNVTGIVRQLPDTLIEACPGSLDSPLDALLGRYIHGKPNTLYVRGSDSPSLDTPRWITDLMADVTVPVPLPGKTFGHLIKNFSLTDTHFSLPSPFAGDDDPESNPRISANIKVLVALPEDMNFNLSVGRVRADADVFYHGKQLGKLDLHKWQKANSTRLPPSAHDESPTLSVESRIEDAPLMITDDDVFTDVIQAIVFGGKGVVLGIKADVDVEVETALGELVVRKIPAEGKVPVKPIDSPSTPGDPGHHDGSKNNSGLASRLKPKIFNLSIIDTTASSLTIAANLNLTNPTKYTASIPYADIHILVNGSLIGHATVRDLSIGTGENTNLHATAVWDPLTLGGKKAAAVGRNFLSQYISGYNTTLTLQMHRDSIAAPPPPGETHSPCCRFMPPPPPPAAPTQDPKDPDDGKKSSHFIEDAVMHLISSTATFTLLSPLRTSTLYITSVNATAFYHEPGAETSDPVGKILYELPFAVPPVDEHGNGITTPRLPVEWSLGSVGYDAVKNALGGTLKLSAEAVVGIKLGWWEEEVWYKGGSIGAKVRL